jgi:hypothetical protein
MSYIAFVTQHILEETISNKHIRSRKDERHRSPANYISEARCPVCGEDKGRPDATIRHEKEIHGLVYNSRIQMLYTPLPSVTMLSVEANKECRNPPETYKSCQSDTSGPPMDDAHDLDIVELENVVPSRNIHPAYNIYGLGVSMSDFSNDLGRHRSYTHCRSNKPGQYWDSISCYLTELRE